MRSFAPGLKKLAATVIFFAAVEGVLLGADPQLPPSKRNAPKGQKIEFSTGTSPDLPKPTPRVEELQNRPGVVQDSGSPVSPTVGATPQQAPPMSKALADRMLQQLDRRKNWMVPGAQDAEFSGMMSEWMKEGFEKKDGKETDEEKNQSVLERFLNGTDQKNRGQSRRKNDSENGPESDSDNNRDEKGIAGGDGKSDENGLDFNLQGALGSAQRKDPFGVKDLNKPANTFRTDFGRERSDRDREMARERGAANSAEFQQLIRPRTPGAFSGIPDPINSAPDLTRREMNPILPRATEPMQRPETSSFGAPPPTGGFGAQDRGMFGVTVPTTPSFNPTPVRPNPTPTTTFRPASSIILDPPKRPF